MPLFPTSERRWRIQKKREGKKWILAKIPKEKEGGRRGKEERSKMNIKQKPFFIFVVKTVS